MNPDRQRLAEDIFRAALALDTSRRATLVDSRCGDDAELRQEVQSLLAAADEGDGPLDDVGAALGEAIASAGAASSLPAGRHIGPYRIVSVLGMGGMGIVYVAEQARPSRTVALKVIRPGLATPSVARRFEYEAEVLGRLQHPGIAQIIEAGTADTGFGPQPFFAMELVQGLPLTDYCARHRLGLRERIAMMIKVCEAVEHAHVRGVIHRDLKPPNILVDATGQPKVLDFGVARAAELKPDDQRLTLLKTGEHQLVGTLAYMSPEQVSGDPLDIDTRSDVYALGILLFELLTGKLPHAAGTTLPEAMRAIRDDEPLRPSTFDATLRGDLDTIAAKVLAKEKDRRYGSAADLAADLGRFLDDAPILARPASRIYHFQKFARRNKALVGGLVLAFVSLAIGLSLALVKQRESEAAQRSSEASAITARAAEQEAKRAAKRSDQVAQLLKDALESIDPNVALGRDTTLLRQVLATATERLERDLAGEPEVETELRIVIGDVYSRLSMTPQAQEMYTRALEINRRTPGAEHATAGLLARLGRIVLLTDANAAEKMLREALDLRRAEVGEDHPDYAEPLQSMTAIYMQRGEYAQAVLVARKVLEIDERAYGPEREETAIAMHNVGSNLCDSGKPGEGEPYLRRALATFERLHGHEHPSVAMSLGKLSETLASQHKVAEAAATARESLALLRKLLVNPHRDIAFAAGHLGNLLSAEGKTAEALPLIREEVEILEQIGSRDTIEMVLALQTLGATLGDTGDHPGAVQAFRDAWQIHLDLLGPSAARCALSEYELGNELAHQGDHAAAEPFLEHAVEVLESQWHGGDRQVAIVRAALGTTLAELAFDCRRTDPTRAVERAETAADCMRRSLADFEGAQDELYARAARMQLGAALTALGAAQLATREEEKDAARASFGEAEELLTAVYESVRGPPASRPSSYARPTLAYAAQWLVRLYEAWETIEPGERIAAKRREWSATGAR